MLVLLAVVALALLAVVAAAAIVAFNRLTRARQAVREAWAQIDVMLARRHRLVTDLATVAAGSAAFERTTTVALVAARDEAAGSARAAGPVRRGEAEGELDDRVAQLVARAEAYPELGADDAFRKVRLELVGAEDDVSAARRYYNGRVRLYHDTTGSFPSNLLTGLFGFGPAEYFQIERDEREVPRAD